MEVYKLPERRDYWRTESVGIFPAMNFGQYMARARFEEIASNIQFSFAEDRDQQVLDYITAVNENLKEAIIPGDTVCLDESMVKSFHRGLK